MEIAANVVNAPSDPNVLIVATAPIAVSASPVLLVSHVRLPSRLK